MNITQQKEPEQQKYIQTNQMKKKSNMVIYNASHRNHILYTLSIRVVFALWISQETKKKKNTQPFLLPNSHTERINSNKNFASWLHTNSQTR